MRKGLVVLLAAIVVALFAVPAMAELSASGFIRAKGHIEQNYNNFSAAKGSFILPLKDPQTASYVEQRARIKFEFKGENAGGVAFFEIDYTNFGDQAYQVARNNGAGLEADEVNLETKNVFLWFNVPNTSMKFQVGMQNQTDSFGGMIFGYADMAGVFLTGKLEPVDYRLGWAKLEQQGQVNDVGVDLYVAEVKIAPVKEARIGLDVYVIRDASGNTANAANTGSNATTLRTALRGFQDYTGTLPTFTYTPSVFYFVGLDGSFDAGVAKISGYAFYNGGKVKDASFAGGVAEDEDVKAWAADLRVDAALGPGKGFIEAAYVSGTDSGDSDIKSPVTTSNYALAGSFPLTSMDMQILFPNIDDINASGALAYDVQNKLRGIIAVAAGFTMKLTDALTGKVGVGYLQDAKETFSEFGGKKHKATEINANVNYNVTKGVDVGIYGAYAFLSDWENYRGAGNTAIVTEDADNIYKVFGRVNYAF